MLSLGLSDIYTYVKSRLDELSNNDDALLVSNNQGVEDLEKEIDAVVEPAIRKIHLDAPNILLKEGNSLAGSDVSAQDRASVSEYYIARINVPNDFLRLVTLKLNEWERPIQTLLGEDSAEYRKQQNPYLMGTPQRPVGFLTHQGQKSNGVIELYSIINNNPVITFGWYVPNPVLNNNVVDIIETLKYPCLNQITAEVLRSLGRHQEAVVYDRLAVQPFYIDPDYARLNPPTSERFNSQTN